MFRTSALPAAHSPKQHSRRAAGVPSVSRTPKALRRVTEADEVRSASDQTAVSRGFGREAIESHFRVVDRRSPSRCLIRWIVTQRLSSLVASLVGRGLTSGGNYG
jgi:hypothetical protein